jgi:hypothetical protein
MIFQSGLQQYYNEGKTPQPTIPAPLDLILTATTQADGNLFCNFTR